MIPLKATSAVFALVLVTMISPSMSFAQSESVDNPISSFFDLFRQLFSFNQGSDNVDEFGKAVVLETSSTSSVENIPPTADAGPDQTVLEFATVTLDGSSSTDTDGHIVSYQWTQISDPHVELSSSTAIKPTFDAPEVDSDIVIRFSLEVTDNSGDSSSDEVDITIQNQNIPPTADAGPDQTVLEFATVTLDGSSSTDTDGHIVSYQWNQTNGTVVTLSSLSDIKPTFDAPAVDSQEILKFMLTVTDNSGDSSSDEVEITVNNNGNNDDNNGNNDDNNGNNDDNNGNHTSSLITICHIPSGNPGNAHTITVSAASLQAHLKHGDTIGECQDSNTRNIKENQGNSDNSNRNQNNNEDNQTRNNGNDSEANSSDKDQNHKDNQTQSNSEKEDSNQDNPGKENQGHKTNSEKSKNKKDD